MAKMTRERNVKEKRARKQERSEERKLAAAEEAARIEAGLPPTATEGEETEASEDSPGVLPEAELTSERAAG